MILRGSVSSGILEMDTGITVVGPNKFSMDNPYKVVYLLHGLWGSNGNWADYTMLPVYAKDYDIIFILPEVARSFYTDMKYGQKFFSYITEELPVISKSIFNISAERMDTAVIGASMGGYGALKCALSKPEQYGYCCAFSSACLFLREGLEYQRANEETEEFKAAYSEQLIKDFHAIFGQGLEWSPSDEILELAKKANMQSIKPKIYSACGTDDFLHKDNIRFNSEMKKLGYDFTYEEWTGNHDWYFFNEALGKALKVCFGGTL
jgi:S-formylglutathione hydrolase FrmB